MTESVTSSLAVKITGATYRQLDYWASAGFIELERNASGSGSRRRWNYNNCIQAARLSDLASNGPGGMAIEELSRLVDDGYLKMQDAVLYVDFRETDSRTKKLWDEIIKNDSCQEEE